MCGIFGLVATREAVDRQALTSLVSYSEVRGADSSGLIYHVPSHYEVVRANYRLTKLAKRLPKHDSSVVMGHSRLITNGLGDNQPVIRDGVAVIHNGIVVNHADIWPRIGQEPRQQIDTEVIAAIAATHLQQGGEPSELADRVLELCRGVVACAVLVPAIGKLFLFSNNGSLYVGTSEGALAFASQAFPLQAIGCAGIKQVKQATIVDVSMAGSDFAVHEYGARQANLIPDLPWCIKSRCPRNLVRASDRNAREAGSGQEALTRMPLRTSGRALGIEAR